MDGKHRLSMRPGHSHTALRHQGTFVRQLLYVDIQLEYMCNDDLSVTAENNDIAIWDNIAMEATQSGRESKWDAKVNKLSDVDSIEIFEPDEDIPDTIPSEIVRIEVFKSQTEQDNHIFRVWRELNLDAVISEYDDNGATKEEPIQETFLIRDNDLTEFCSQQSHLTIEEILKLVANRIQNRLRNANQSLMSKSMFGYF